MVRQVKDKYGAWLVGYYDDFNGARAIPHDFNTPDTSIAGVYTHGLTHYGNPLNGEATLNPRFRWSFYDRQTSLSAYGIASASTQPYAFVSDTKRFLHNKGNYEWLSYDSNRNYSAKRMGRSQLQYPDGHSNTNSFRTFPRTNAHPQPGDAFQLFCNGHNTLGRYVVPTGDLDSSFGRQDMTGYADNTTYKAGNSGKNSWVRLSTMTGTGSNINGNTSTLKMVRRAHLAGKWMGETLLFTDASISNDQPKNIFATLESPSGMPFLCVQQYEREGANSTPALPTMYYDGTLNSRDTHDILTFRMAIRSFNGAGKITPKVTIKAGYTSSPTTGNFENGLVGTPVISFDLDITGYDTLPYLYENSTTASSYNNDDSWLDVDVHLNYDTQKYDVYKDGNKILSEVAFNGSNIKAEDMYGWQIYMHALSGSNNVSSTLMLDRVSLCRPLTDDPTERELPSLKEMSYQSTINGYSSITLQLEDDANDYDSISNYGFSTSDYAHNFTSVFSGNKLSDWGIVLFAGGGKTGRVDIPHIDRPVWRGLLSNINISEKRKGRKISITAQDSLITMEKQIPMWELGQNKKSTTDQYSAYWNYDAEGLLEVMDMGTSVLKQFSSKIGREFTNDYENVQDQRTQLGSSHPIQMYNNEDSFGPNSIWEDYEGMGIDYFYEDNTGMRLVLSGNPNIGGSGSITVNYSGRAALDNKSLTITAHHSMNAAGDIVTYSTSDPHEVLTVAKGSGAGQMNYTNEYQNICYVGKYIGPSAPHDDSRFEFNSTVDLDKNTAYNEFINNHPASWLNGRGSVGNIKIKNPGGGYSIANGYYTTVNGQQIRKGTVTLPSPATPGATDYSWVGESATAEWESESTFFYSNVGSQPFVGEAADDWLHGRIHKVTVTNPGKGYNATGANMTTTTNWFNTDRVASPNTHNNEGVATMAIVSTKKALLTDPNTEANLVGADWDALVNQSTLFDGVYHVAKPITSGVDGLIINDVGSGDDIVIKLKFTGGTTDSVTGTIIAGGNNVAVDDVLKCRVQADLQVGGQVLSHWVYVRFKVATLTEDAEFEFEWAEQAQTDYLTFFFSTETNVGDKLSVGDDFVISNSANSTDYTTTAGAKVLIRGKHTAKKITKVLNFHGNPLSPDNRQRYLWQVQTYTPLPDDWEEGTLGNFDINYGLLKKNSFWTSMGNGNEHLGWSPKRKLIITSALPASHTENITSRVVHAKWMQDLPHSLYFKYHFAQIQYTPNETIDAVSQIDSGATEVEITQTGYDNIPNAGVAVIQRPQTSLNFESRQDIRDFFVYRCKYVDNSSGSNKYYLGNCKFITNSHATSVMSWASVGVFQSNPTQIHIIENKDSYKHLWLLWADMRNDGSADADGGLRKKEFGLKSPVKDNYKLKIQFDDQLDENGEYKTFTDLSMGDDYDLWSMDATYDPSTKGAFSKPLDYGNTVGITGGDVSSVGGKLSINKNSHGFTTGDYVGLINFDTYDGVYTVTATDANNFVVDVSYSSGFSGSITKYFYAKTTGSDASLPVYKDWENKGGAFIVIDTSKFFNLNTIANKGGVFQEGGGQTDLGEYYAVGVGDPVLIDSYYRNAASTSLTTDNDYHNHLNIKKLVSGKTSLSDSIYKGEFWLEPTDLSIFDDNGIGRIIGAKIESDERSQWFYQWNGKISDDITASSVTVTAPTVGDTHWVISKSGSTFLSDGVKAGAYIQNTSKALTAGVGSSWRVGDAQVYYYRVKKVVNETTLHVEKVIYYSFEKALAAGEETIGLKSGLRIREGGLTAYDIADGWVTGHDLKICKQLFNVALDSITIATTDNTWSESGIETTLTQQLNDFVSSGGSAEPHIRTEINNSYWPVLNIYNSVANEFAYRLMAKLDGKYLNLNSGTFYASDKLRTLWNSSLLDAWGSKTKVSAMYDINNVPISDKLSTYNTNDSEDSYGGVLNTNSKTILDTVKKTQKQTGVGFNNSLFTSFSWLVGRDNRLELRPKYNSGYNLTRNDVKVSDFSMSQKERVDYVRCIYDGGNQFVDYPSPAIGDTTTWKIIEEPNATNRVEAMGLAEREYNIRKNNPIALQVEPLPLFAPQDEDVMLDGGRYGYIADAQIATQGDDDDSNNLAWCWTVQGTGGVLFPGMVNGLDGNLGNIVTDSTIYTRSGSSSLPTDATITHNNNYTTYGSRSVSYAMQIVHVGKDIPRVSSSTGERLRIAVALKPGQSGKDIDSAIFRVYLIDASYTNPNSYLQLVGSVSESSFVDCQHNGFYEIDVPSSYHSSGKIVISFNADYCRDLLRTRCGGIDIQSSGVDVILRNGQTNIGGANATITLESSHYNTASIFPLGPRMYSNYKGGMGDMRALYYAPSLHIVDDLVYMPGTFLKYTDAGFDIDNLTMVIKTVDWHVSDKKETVKLHLSEDESVSSLGIMDYIFAPPKLPNPDGLGSVGNVSIPPTGTGLTTEPTPGTPINGNWDEDNTQGVSDGGGGGDFGVSGINLNDFDRGTYLALMRNLIGGGSEFTAQYGNNILGQTKTSTTPSSMRGMGGPLRVHPTQGSATSNGNGFDLPGKGKDEGVGAGETAFSKKEVEHKVEVEIKAPKDAITDEVNISADIKLPATANTDRSATLKVHARCVETGAEFTETVNIPTGTNKSNMEISSTTNLSGAGSSGNTLVFTFSRSPGTGADNANYSTLSVTNIDINFRRAAFNADNRSNIFMPFR